jgi:hypothetical protein
MVPCFLAAAHTSLVRLTDQVLATSEIYAAFLPERRGEARLRVVIDALLEIAWERLQESGPMHTTRAICRNWFLLLSMSAVIGRKGCV